jgi:hypothetical protein
VFKSSQPVAYTPQAPKTSNIASQINPVDALMMNSVTVVDGVWVLRVRSRKVFVPVGHGSSAAVRCHLSGTLYANFHILGMQVQH